MTNPSPISPQYIPVTVECSQPENVKISIQESLRGPTDDETMEAQVDHFKIVQIVQRGEPYSIYRVIPERLTPETSRVLFLDETEIQDEPQSMPLPPPSSPCPQRDPIQSIEPSDSTSSTLETIEDERSFIMKTMTVQLLARAEQEAVDNQREEQVKVPNEFGRNMNRLRKEYEINKIVSERPNSNHVVHHYAMTQSFRLTVPLFWLEPNSNSALFSYFGEVERKEMETRKFLLSMSTNRVAIIMEDAGTQSMMQLIPEGGLSVLQFLNYAIQLSKAIGTLHLHNVIHRNIRPENIVVDMDSHKLTLIDFNQAQFMKGDIDIEQSVNTRATVAEAPNSISSLAYISPEQTYRLNRGVDYRTDIYSLGVTLYHMITGQLPFDSDLDPMGLIHCHITKQPEEPISVCAKSNKLIPQMISDIIMKLMKKDPSERYQSSGGLLFDLELCQRCYRSSFSIPFFELATEDRSNHFPLPFFNLYGREKETRAITHTYHHVSVSGLPEAIFVAGNSGIGKSSLIYEVQRQLLTGNSYCVSGKFDQLDRNVAYSAIGQAFRMLIQMVLTEPEDRLTMWKNKLLSVLGVNGQLVINIIPELQNLIGDQPSVQSMGVSETRLRFNSVFSNFVSVFAKDCTLALFIDDLQWADAASVSIIEVLLTNDNLRHFVFVGCYRDTDVNQPVLSMIEELKRSDVRVTTIHLYPLTLEHVKEWLADLLYLKEFEVSELAEHVYTRSEGNPFFVKCLIQSIYDAGFLTKSTRWEWDMENIRSLPPTASLVDLLVQKLGKFQEETIETLKIASCFGCSFQLSYLAKYLQVPSESLIKQLKPAFFAGLAFVFENDFCFSHDKVQDAIYSQISKERKGVIHFKIGCILLDDREPEEISDDICDITDQFNHSLDEIDRIPNFKEETTVFKLSRMNYYAALKMINSIAYHSALMYLLTSARLLSMLGDEDYLWEHYYSFCFNLHKNLALTFFYNDKFSDSTKKIDLLVERTKSMIDLAEVQSIKVTHLTSQMKYREALVCGIETLRQMGVYIPQREEMQLEMESEKETTVRTLKHYHALIPDMDERVNHVSQSIKIMDDPKSKAICGLSNSMNLAMYFVNRDLYRLLCIKTVNISFDKGESPTSPHSFAVVGAIFAESMKHMNISKELFMISLKLAERNPAQKCIVYQTFATCGAHWFFHKKHSEKYICLALESGIQTGNLIWSGYIEATISLNMLYCSSPIDDALATYSKNHRFVSKVNNPSPYYILQIVLLLLHKLIGRRCKLSRSELEKTEEILARELDDGKLFHARHFYYTIKLLQAAMDDNRDSWCTAYQFIIEAEKQIELIREQYQYVWLTLYSTLVCINIIDELQDGAPLIHPVPAIDGLRRRVDKSLERMKFWMKHCPSNFQNKYEMMLAEYLRIQGDKWEAARFYDESIAHAAQNGFTHEEAIAAEFAFRFWKKNKREEIAKIYLKRAFESYNKWGATWKLDQMIQVYPEILENIAPTDLYQYHRDDIDVASTANVNLALLDLDRVINASQIISSTIDIEQLLFNVMKIIIEIGHAQKGAIIINGNIEAEYSTTDDNDDYQILHSTPLNMWEHGCRDIINRVQSTHETVVLSSAIDDPQFGSNSYIVQNKCKSILCSPVILQNKLLAILYMENNLISDVFSEHRMTVLNILTSQMAISLENAISFKDRLESAQKIAEVERKRAEDAETYKKNLELFVDSICHEIRNPIFGIYGNLDHLRTIVDRLSNEVGRKSIAEMREALKSIDICTTHQKAITDDVLTLSKLESNMVQLNRKVFNPNLMISSIVSMFEVEVSNKHLKLITKMPEQDKSVYGDSTRISQVIINLMSNSVKFTSEGTITLSLDVQTEHNSDNIKLSFCVGDTGLGMSEKEIEHLFHRFTQGITRTEKEYSGSGLGMYISKHLVELMGGEIKVDSKKGEGTRVSFYVYCQKPPETRNEVSIPQDNKNEKDESETRPLKVLIVEDNKINQTILKRFLTQKGHSVQVANNGSEACDVFQTMIHNPFDVIFMDIEMPIMNGLEATRVIREIEASSHIERTPIIGISGNARSLHADMAKEAGMNQYITKPVSKEQIYRVISTVVPVNT